MKNRFIILVLFFVSFSLFAQNPKLLTLYRGKLSNKDFFKKSEFIFDAIPLSYKCYLNKDSSQAYTSVTMQVTQVYMGFNKIHNGTIELVFEGGEVGSLDSGCFYKNDYPDFSFDYGLNGAVIIFFCVTSDYLVNPEPQKFENTIPVKLLNNEIYAGMYYINDRDFNFKIYGLNQLFFKDKSEFYNYIKKYKGIKVPENAEKQEN